MEIEAPGEGAAAYGYRSPWHPAKLTGASSSVRRDVFFSPANTLSRERGARIALDALEEAAA